MVRLVGHAGGCITTCCKDCVFLGSDHTDCSYCILDEDIYLDTPHFGAPPVEGYLAETCPLKLGPITVALRE